MSSQKKKTVAGIVIVLVVVVAVTVAVVSIVTRTPKPDVVGTYTGQNGREIRIAKDGTFTEITLPRWGLTAKGPNHYWVSGKSITIGDSKSRPKGPPTFKVEGNNRLVGYGTVWVRHLVEPNRPSSIVGTYASSDGETLALNKNGAAYDSRQEPSGPWIGPVLQLHNTVDAQFSFGLTWLPASSLRFTHMLVKCLYEGIIWS